MFRPRVILLAALGALLSCSSDTTPSCPAPRSACGPTCVDLTLDPANCGTCGHACGSREVCVAGRCQLNCPTGQQQCGTACTDVATDRANCGGCGMRCPTGQVCADGACALTCGAALATCVPGVNGLDAASGEPYCANTRVDRENCGACGTRCDVGEFCVQGRCVLVCPDGQANCSGRCVDLQTDSTNCGACRTPCGSGFVCNAGRCRSTACSGTSTMCNGQCVDTMTDPYNCGRCSFLCLNGQNCVAGACGSARRPRSACGDECVRRDDRRAQLRRLRTRRRGTVCQGGACVTVCQTGQVSRLPLRRPEHRPPRPPRRLMACPGSQVRSAGGVRRELRDRADSCYALHEH
ncbi:MAG: hypothetical protein U0325_36900 [Polyangiales bacterium]